jgi:AraC-like DNA-binding protein
MALESDLPAAGHIDEVAAKLGVSRRSLQRRLAAEHSSFTRVLDQTRQHRSLDLIQRRRMTVAAIASQVGFANARAFHAGLAESLGLPLEPQGAWRAVER